ncbi:Pregnancy zone protein [Trichinella pseudospiralis]
MQFTNILDESSAEIVQSFDDQFSSHVRQRRYGCMSCIRFSCRCRAFPAFSAGNVTDSFYKAGMRAVFQPTRSSVYSIYNCLPFGREEDDFTIDVKNTANKAQQTRRRLFNNNDNMLAKSFLTFTD